MLRSADNGLSGANPGRSRHGESWASIVAIDPVNSVDSLVDACTRMVGQLELLDRAFYSCIDYHDYGDPAERQRLSRFLGEANVAEAIAATYRPTNRSSTARVCLFASMPRDRISSNARSNTLPSTCSWLSNTVNVDTSGVAPAASALSINAHASSLLQSP